MSQAYLNEARKVKCIGSNLTVNFDPEEIKSTLRKYRIENYAIKAFSAKMEENTRVLI